MLLELASVAGHIVYVNPSQVVLIRDGSEPGLVDVVVATGETIVARGRTPGVASLLEHVFREHTKGTGGAGRYSERPSTPSQPVSRPQPMARDVRPSSAPPPRASGPAPARPRSEPPAATAFDAPGPTRRLTPFQRGGN